MNPNELIDIVVCPATRAQARQSEAAIIPFDDGRLFMAYTNFYTKDSSDYGFARIDGRWSHDYGATWSDPFIIQDNYSVMNIMQANPVRLPSGRIILIFARVLDRGGDRGYQIIHLDLIHSDDEAKTWSKPRQFTIDDIENMTTNDRLVQLKSGRLMIPASGARSPVWISDDDGQTWRQGKGAFECAAEPVVVELPSGVIKLYSREGSAGPYRHLYCADSHDQGETWTPARENVLRSHAVPCIAKVIPDTGDLFMIWNNADIRSNLTCAISKDEGRTWGHFRSLESLEAWPMMRSHSYPSISFHQDLAHMTYWEVDKDPEVGALIHTVYRRMPISWFYEPQPSARRDRRAALIAV